jgi:hypothetical protein
MSGCVPRPPLQVIGFVKAKSGINGVATKFKFAILERAYGEHRRISLVRVSGRAGISYRTAAATKRRSETSFEPRAKGRRASVRNRLQPSPATFTSRFSWTVALRLFDTFLLLLKLPPRFPLPTGLRCTRHLFVFVIGGRAENIARASQLLNVPEPPRSPCANATPTTRWSGARSASPHRSE